jgi:hypothetical protein
MDTSGLDWEIILADNAGNAETARIAESFSTLIPVKLVVETAPGKNNALNTALKYSNDDLIIFTDDDVIPDPAWAKELVDVAGRWETADIFGGRILPRYPAGQTVPLIDDPVFFRVAYSIADLDLPEGNYPAGKIWGANMMVRRRVFEQGLRFNTDIGPSGSNYVMGSETEFLQRASDAGFTAVYAPSAVVYHQIRSEQLTCSWIYGRAFRVGRGLAYHDQSGNELKVKKWMLREIAVLYVRYLYSSLFGTEQERLASGIKFHRMRGQLYQSYIGRT